MSDTGLQVVNFSSRKMCEDELLLNNYYELHNSFQGINGWLAEEISMVRDWIKEDLGITITTEDVAFASIGFKPIRVGDTTIQPSQVYKDVVEFGRLTRKNCKVNDSRLKKLYRRYGCEYKNKILDKHRRELANKLDLKNVVKVGTTDQIVLLLKEYLCSLTDTFINVDGKYTNFVNWLLTPNSKRSKNDIIDVLTKEKLYPAFLFNEGIDSPIMYDNVLVANKQIKEKAFDQSVAKAIEICQQKFDQTMVLRYCTGLDAATFITDHSIPYAFMVRLCAFTGEPISDYLAKFSIQPVNLNESVNKLGWAIYTVYNNSGELNRILFFDPRDKEWKTVSPDVFAVSIVNSTPDRSHNADELYAVIKKMYTSLNDKVKKSDSPADDSLKSVEPEISGRLKEFKTDGINCF